MFRYIVAMSFDRKKVKDMIIDASKEINKHIIKLLMFPESRDVNHWKQEIVNFLEEVPKLSSTKKFPTAKFIMDALSGYDDISSSFIKLNLRNYAELHPKEISEENAIKAVVEYHEFIAESLSHWGVVYRDEAYEKLNEIMNKYSAT